MSDYSLKEIMNKPEHLAPGHRMCAGCGATIAVRAVLRGLHEGDHAVIGNATGCLEVSSYMYPYTAWEDSYIHNAFENAGPDPNPAAHGRPPAQSPTSAGAGPSRSKGSGCRAGRTAPLQEDTS